MNDKQILIRIPTVASPKDQRKSWICYEPHKRVRLPDKDDYSLYRSERGISNRVGYVVEVFSGGVSDELFAEWNRASMALYHAHMNQYYNHKLQNPEYYVQTYEEANMTHRFIYRDFKSDYPIDPYTNWFGVSVYQPNLTFTRENKKILMSLQGMAMPSPGTNEDWALADAKACKYIGFYENGKALYETWSGQLPEQDWIENFIQ